MADNQFSEEARQEPPRCFLCASGDEDRPLLALRFQGLDGWVCPRCMPRLIHPER